MKYAVVCYAVHDRDLLSCDLFSTKQEAFDFAMADAKDTFNETKVDDPTAEFKDFLDYDGSIYLSSCDGEAEWTWHVRLVKGE